MELSLIFACHLRPGRAVKEGSWLRLGGGRGRVNEFYVDCDSGE